MSRAIRIVNTRLRQNAAIFGESPSCYRFNFQHFNHSPIRFCFIRQNMVLGNHPFDMDRTGNRRGGVVAGDQLWYGYDMTYACL
ncbi:hypothetical protein [Negadavirga shengliensis]|uniref:Uncharacterized protein n=1 Tax=Negadavirga shengliensis TaxID=1389218 RepID=A0ABV9T456_9BACT